MSVFLGRNREALKQANDARAPDHVTTGHDSPWHEAKCHALDGLSISAMETFPLCLPVVTIQPSFTEVIKEVQDGIIPSENFWVSCYKNLETSLHGKVKVELDDVDRNLIKTRTIEGDVEVTRNFEGVSRTWF